MRRIGKIFIFSGIVLIIGPFFGFTVRGQQMTAYSDGLFLAAFAITLGSLIVKFAKRT